MTLDRYSYFRQFSDLPKADYELLSGRLGVRSFRKGESLVVPGQIQRDVYFVNSGIQMSSFEGKNKIHVMAFTYAPNVCVLPDSFAFQSPSNYTITCITDSTLEYLSFSELQLLFDQSQPLERLFRRMTEAVLAGLINRHLDLQTKTMEERFHAFCQRSGPLLNLVPHKYIASYLDIDPTNFSKLFNRVRI